MFVLHRGLGGGGRVAVAVVTIVAAVAVVVRVVVAFARLAEGTRPMAHTDESDALQS